MLMSETYKTLGAWDDFVQIGNRICCLGWNYQNAVVFAHVDSATGTGLQYITDPQTSSTRENIATSLSQRHKIFSDGTRAYFRGTQNTVLCVDPANNTLIWQSPLGEEDPVYAPLAILGDSLLCVSNWYEYETLVDRLCNRDWSDEDHYFSNRREKARGHSSHTGVAALDLTTGALLGRSELGGIEPAEDLREAIYEYCFKTSEFVWDYLTTRRPVYHYPDGPGTDPVLSYSPYGDWTGHETGARPTHWPDFEDGQPNPSLASGPAPLWGTSLRRVFAYPGVLEDAILSEDGDSWLLDKEPEPEGTGLVRSLFGPSSYGCTMIPFGEQSMGSVQYDSDEDFYTGTVNGHTSISSFTDYKFNQVGEVLTARQNLSDYCVDLLQFGRWWKGDHLEQVQGTALIRPFILSEPESAPNPTPNNDPPADPIPGDLGSLVSRYTSFGGLIAQGDHVFYVNPPNANVLSGQFAIGPVESFPDPLPDDWQPKPTLQQKFFFRHYPEFADRFRTIHPDVNTEWTATTTELCILGPRTSGSTIAKWRAINQYAQEVWSYTHPGTLGSNSSPPVVTEDKIHTFVFLGGEWRIITLDWAGGLISDLPAADLRQPIFDGLGFYDELARNEFGPDPIL